MDVNSLTKTQPLIENQWTRKTTISTVKLISYSQVVEDFIFVIMTAGVGKTTDYSEEIIKDEAMNTVMRVDW